MRQIYFNCYTITIVALCSEESIKHGSTKVNIEVNIVICNFVEALLRDYVVVSFRYVHGKRHIEN